ncbi:hypothetical protein CAP35_00610 [Chitinophagaceae bacterium IBVUCB1]|nr:hypothetical protein CAP35_00610 [Chitinophagaceae bacterium IBVUCB1]
MKLKKSFAAIFLTVCFTSCKLFSKSNDGVIQPDNMKLILSDLHIAEVYSSMVNDSLYQVRDKNKDSLAVYYKTVLTHHNITKEQLVQSIKWYKMHPAELDSVYADMITDFSKLESEYPVK